MEEKQGLILVVVMWIQNIHLIDPLIKYVRAIGDGKQNKQQNMPLLCSLSEKEKQKKKSEKPKWSILPLLHKNLLLKT